MQYNSNPLFSVVIPTYNHGHLIGRCLQSLITQTFKNWEAIVVNNFSADQTIEVVDSFNDSRIRLINFSNNGLIAASRNVGILNSIAEWICFLDSDDWWYSNKLESCLSFLSDYDILYHDLDMYNSKGIIKYRKIKARKLSGDLTRDLIVNGNGIPTSSVAVRKYLLTKIEGFVEQTELISVEDSDCWLRLAVYSKRFKYIPRSLGAYWIGGNISVSIKQIEREQELLNRHIHKLDGKDKILASKTLSYRQARIYHKLKMLKQARQSYIRSLTTNKLLRNTRAAVLYFISLLKVTF